MKNPYKLIKNTDLNNILKDYSILTFTNSYILNYNASKTIAQYQRINEEDDQATYFTIYNELGFQYENQSPLIFNKEENYYVSDYNIEPNSIIISNLAYNDSYAYDQSYIIYYNTSTGLRQLTYHYKEGNGLYYDENIHCISFNIDNYSIKEINDKLYFDTNSLPIASNTTYGISYINNEYLQVNNGILTVNHDYIENVISYKYKIANLYNSLSSLQDSFAYYDRIYNERNNTINEFSRYCDNIIRYNSNNSNINKTFSYSLNNSLYFPETRLFYIDNYYFSNNMIPESYKKYAQIELNEDISYIIYCKNLELLDIYSYNANKFYSYSTSFNENILNNFEKNIKTNYDDSSKKIVSENNIYSYVYVDDINKYNKFLLNTNIVNNNYITDIVNFDIKESYFIFDFNDIEIDNDIINLINSLNNDYDFIHINNNKVIITINAGMHIDIKSIQNIFQLIINKIKNIETYINNYNYININNIIENVKNNMQIFINNTEQLFTYTIDLEIYINTLQRENDENNINVDRLKNNINNHIINNDYQYIEINNDNKLIININKENNNIDLFDIFANIVNIFEIIINAITNTNKYEIANQYIQNVNNFEDDFNEMNNYVKTVTNNYNYTLTKIKYNNKNIDSKLFKKYGIMLNSKLNTDKIKLCSIDYLLVNTNIKYTLNLDTINIKYNNRTIKVLNDDRDIAYCVYNENAIINNSTYYYFLVNGILTNELTIDNNSENSQIIKFMLKNYDISFDSNLTYLFYGYNYCYYDKYKKKNYYGLWHDLPLQYVNISLFRNYKLKYLDINNFEEMFIKKINSYIYTNESPKNRLYLTYIYNDSNEQKIGQTNIYIDF